VLFRGDSADDQGGGIHIVHEFIALFTFDRSGYLLEAHIDALGLRDELDPEHAEKVFQQRLLELGPITYGSIQIFPFQVEKFGVVFGLIPRQLPKDGIWEVTLEPGNYMSFKAPWDSGIYET
jgi:hypothetical protein